MKWLLIMWIETQMNAEKWKAKVTYSIFLFSSTQSLKGSVGFLEKHAIPFMYWVFNL